MPVFPAVGLLLLPELRPVAPVTLHMLLYVISGSACQLLLLTHSDSANKYRNVMILSGRFRFKIYGTMV